MIWANLTDFEPKQTMDAHIIHWRGLKRAETNRWGAKIKAQEQEQFNMTQQAPQEHIYLCWKLFHQGVLTSGSSGPLKRACNIFMVFFVKYKKRALEFMEDVAI